MRATLGFLLVLPFWLITGLGGIVSFVWLAILGEWGLVLGGLGYGVTGALAIGLVIIILMAIASPFPKFIGLCLLILGVAAMMLGSAAFLFRLALSYVDGNSIWPFLLWANGTATAPWVIAQGRTNDPNSQLLVSSLAWAGFGMTSAILVMNSQEWLTLVIAGVVGAIVGLIHTLIVGYLMTPPEQGFR